MIVWLNTALGRLPADAGTGMHRVSAPVVGFAGLTHLGLCSAVGAAEQRL